jgi:predicted RNase H-like HicB family nuclease
MKQKYNDANVRFAARRRKALQSVAGADDSGFYHSCQSPKMLSMATFLRFFDAAMDSARYEKTEEGEWFASIPGFAGLWATGPTIEATRKDLLEALDGWIEVTIKTGNRVPDVGAVSLYDNLLKVADD